MEDFFRLADKETEKECIKEANRTYKAIVTCMREQNLDSNQACSVFCRILAHGAAHNSLENPELTMQGFYETIKAYYKHDWEKK